ncbi:hypothetical protein ALQ64_00209 [Pseudomonas cannabina]|uniref:Uncharacterized protein n=1 Tax=Pseudomonas cannabina TaxID=86840 RepID=A0A3M3KDA0_PSECA|nr:hypothetical protein [Pseudomonas cannabina]RMN20401.1 hypothetical protein ALQ64_00209 [Pseudomonas cannabina]
MKIARSTSKLTSLVIAASFGALIFIAACFVLSFFPSFSIPLPTGIPFGRLNVGALGNSPLPYAAVCGALVGVMLILTEPAESQKKAIN